MTKTQLAKLAKQSTQHGFFDHGATLSVDCPLGCGRVTVAHSMWATDGKGKRLSKVAQLQREVSEHITWEHNTTPVCPNWDTTNTTMEATQ